jgi:hypothetical protein
MTASPKEGANLNSACAMNPKVSHVHQMRPMCYMCDSYMLPYSGMEAEACACHVCERILCL